MNDQGRDAAAATDRIELSFTLGPEDFTKALRARNRLTRWGRWQRRLIWLMPLLGAANAALAWSGDSEIPWTLVACCVATPALLVMTPWLGGRQMGKFAAEHGTMHVTIDEEGLTAVSDAGSSTSRWALVSRYVETDAIFALLVGKKAGVGLSVLPKRAMSDPDAVRAMLDRHITRA